MDYHNARLRGIADAVKEYSPFSATVVLQAADEIDRLEADNALLVEERDRLRAERDEMADWIRSATSTITEVIGGGSEMFIRRGDAYRIDPRFVANYIETRRGDLHEARVALVKLRKEQRS